MKLSIDFGRWTTTKAALAVGGALALAGAIGSAVAMSPIITPPIKWQGGAEFNHFTLPGSGLVYTVPAGRNFLLTDLIVANTSGITVGVEVKAGTGGGCTFNTTRIARVVVPNLSTGYLNLQTGIGFAAGQTVCLGASTTDIAVSGRGFLFSPS